MIMHVVLYGKLQSYLMHIRMKVWLQVRVWTC